MCNELHLIIQKHFTVFGYQWQLEIEPELLLFTLEVELEERVVVRCSESRGVEALYQIAIAVQLKLFRASHVVL